MTRVKISAFILAALVLFSAASGTWVNGKCSELLDCGSEIRQNLENDDNGAALDAADEFMHRWESFRSPASVILKSDKLAEIARISSRIIPLIEMDSDEIFADLDELTELIQALQKGEKPIFTSVF